MKVCLIGLNANQLPKGERWKQNAKEYFVFHAMDNLILYLTYSLFLALNANFEDLMRRTEPKHDVIQSRLRDLFNSLAVERQIIGQTDQFKSSQPNKYVYENNFPELFFY